MVCWMAGWLAKTVSFIDLYIFFLLTFNFYTNKSIIIYIIVLARFDVKIRFEDTYCTQTHKRTHTVGNIEDHNRTVPFVCLFPLPLEIVQIT